MSKQDAAIPELTKNQKTVTRRLCKEHARGPAEAAMFLSMCLGERTTDG